MKIVQIYSHLNGLEYLLVHHRKLWKEMQEVIKGVDAEGCKTKVSTGRPACRYRRRRVKSCI